MRRRAAPANDSREVEAFRNVRNVTGKQLTPRERYFAEFHVELIQQIGYKEMRLSPFSMQSHALSKDARHRVRDLCNGRMVSRPQSRVRIATVDVTIDAAKAVNNICGVMMEIRYRPS